MNLFFTLARLVHRLNRVRLRITRPITVGVRVLLVKDDSLVLVRHTYQAGWLLPGGGVKRGETLEQAARREIREETGIAMGRVRLLGVYTNFHEYKSDHVAVFVCEDFQANTSREPAWEIAARKIFPLNELPDDLLPGHRRRVEEYQQSGSSSHAGLW